MTDFERGWHAALVAAAKAVEDTDPVEHGRGYMRTDDANGTIRACVAAVRALAALPLPAPAAAGENCVRCGGSERFGNGPCPLCAAPSETATVAAAIVARPLTAEKLPPAEVLGLLEKAAEQMRAALCANCGRGKEEHSSNGYCGHAFGTCFRAHGRGGEKT